jgi:hypothetical protein
MPAKALRSSQHGLRAFISSLKGRALRELKRVGSGDRRMKTKFLLSRAQRDEVAVLEACYSMIHHKQIISRQQVAYGEQVLASPPGTGAHEKH